MLHWSRRFVLCMPFPLTASSQTVARGVHELMLDQSSPPGATAPAFSPDGKLVLFGENIGSQTFLYESERKSGFWAAPHLASFSGTFTDIEPAFSPDGRFILFSSNRLLVRGGPVADSNYDGKVRTGHGGRLLQVSRTRSGWSDPAPMSSSVNEAASVLSPSVHCDATLYFMQPVSAGEKFHLYRSLRVAGHFSAAQPVRFSKLDAYGDFDPAVLKNGSFLIFSSLGRLLCHIALTCSSSIARGLV